MRGTSKRGEDVGGGVREGEMCEKEVRGREM